MKKICSFFGHRNADKGLRPALYAETEKLITKCQVTTFYLGGYGEFDRMSTIVLKELKQKYPYIEVILILAYLPTKKTNEPEINLYSSTIYPEGLEIVPQRFAITHRNRWITEQSEYVIAYVRTRYGGAYGALRHAKREGKQIINLADGSANQKRQCQARDDD